MRRQHALCLLKLGYAYQAMGDYHAAVDHLEESVTSSVSSGYPTTQNAHARHSTPA
jgi:hypothetical protein